VAANDSFDNPNVCSSPTMILTAF